jgi:hypothetical protein
MTLKLFKSIWLPLIQLKHFRSSVRFASNIVLRDASMPAIEIDGISPAAMRASFELHRQREQATMDD